MLSIRYNMAPRAKELWAAHNLRRCVMFLPLITSVQACAPPTLPPDACNAVRLPTVHEIITEEQALFIAHDEFSQLAADTQRTKYNTIGM